MGHLMPLLEIFYSSNLYPICLTIRWFFFKKIPLDGDAFPIKAPKIITPYYFSKSP